MKLFLATFKIAESPYMGDNKVYPETEMRIVWAENGQEASLKVTKAVEVYDPYGCNRYLVDLDITQAIE